MKYKHLFWAVILIVVGIIFMLNNFGVLCFSWYNFWQLWPLILILWGISILPVKDLFKFIMLITVMGLGVILISKGPKDHSCFLPFLHNGDVKWEWDDDDTSDDNVSFSQNLALPFDSLTRKGILELDAAAGSFIFNGETKDLLSFRKTGDIGNYELTADTSDKVKTITLHLDNEGRNNHRYRKNHVNIQLNSQPPWNLHFNIGAASMDLDLSDYKIDTAHFKAGASSITVKLGDRNPMTYMTFNAGASSIHIKVPKEAGCRINSESFLISRSFEGFEKKDGRMYETENFARSNSKIIIVVKTAISSIDVDRY